MQITQQNVFHISSVYSEGYLTWCSDSAEKLIFKDLRLKVTPQPLLCPGSLLPQHLLSPREGRAQTCCLPKDTTPRLYQTTEMFQPIICSLPGWANGLSKAAWRQLATCHAGLHAHGVICSSGITVEQGVRKEQVDCWTLYKYAHLYLLGSHSLSAVFYLLWNWSVFKGHNFLVAAEETAKYLQRENKASRLFFFLAFCK